MSRFFIHHPVFAWVLAILITFAGALSLLRLPLEQYPDVAPPQVSVSARYNGASADTVNDSVTQIIEQQMKGLDGLMYMSSSADSSGQSRTTLTFEPGRGLGVENTASVATLEWRDAAGEHRTDDLIANPPVAA